MTAWDPPPAAPDRRPRPPPPRPPPAAAAAAAALTCSAPRAPPRRSPSQSFESSPHSCFGRPAAAASPDGSPRQREAARSRARESERTRDRPSRQTARADSIFTRNIPFLAPLGRRSPDPPILKSGEKGVLARRVRALQPQKHPQNTPTPKTPPQNTPQNTQSFECRACAFMLFGRPGGRAARCPDGSTEAAFLKPRGRDQPSNPRPRCRGLYSYTKHPFLAPFGSRSPDPPILKSERLGKFHLTLKSRKEGKEGKRGRGK